MSAEHEVPPEKEVFISVKEACRRLSVSRTTFYRWVRKGYIKTARVDHRRLVGVLALRQFAARVEKGAV